MTDEGVAILWDIENVTPKIDTVFLDGLIEFVENIGRISNAKAYADWTRQNITKHANLLAKYQFELIHTPMARKNSSDIMMITQGIELAHLHPHLKHFVLVTGDVDFRPLILALRRIGRTVTIICDTNTTSENLLSLADNFSDYRQIVMSDEPEEYHKPATTTPIAAEIDDTDDKKQLLAIRNLVDAIDLLENEGKEPNFSATKIKMKILDPNFDESTFGFNKWSDFVRDCKAQGYVTMGGGSQSSLQIGTTKKGEELLEPLNRAYDKITSVLNKLNGGKKDWHNAAELGSPLKKVGLSPKELGYNQLKDLLFAAERRNIIVTKFDGLTLEVKLR